MMVPMTHRFLIMAIVGKPSSYWGLIILIHTHFLVFHQGNFDGESPTRKPIQFLVGQNASEPTKVWTKVACPERWDLGSTKG